MMAPPDHRRLALAGFDTVATAIAAGDTDKSRAAQAGHIQAGIEACRDLGLLE